MFTAYIDTRPILFVLGLPVFVLLVVLACWLGKAKYQKFKIACVAGITFTALFIFFFYGPFIGHTETREFMMTWRTDPAFSSENNGESKVVLSFVDYPEYFTGEYSNDLASHLQANGENEVKVVFEVTYDYGTIRGFRKTEIAGLNIWKSKWGYTGVRGSPEISPWD